MFSHYIWLVVQNLPARNVSNIHFTEKIQDGPQNTENVKLSIVYEISLTDFPLNIHKGKVKCFAAQYISTSHPDFDKIKHEGQKTVTY